MTVRITLILWVVWGCYWLARSFGGAKTAASESLSARASHLLPLALGYMLLYSKVPAFTNLDGSLWERDGAWGWIGVACVAAGMLFAFWARQHLGKYWSGIITLKEGHRLIRTGPYRLARHPIYTGVLLAFLGSMLAVGTGRGVLAFAVVTVAFLIKSRREEANLIRHFGDEYRSYKLAVKAVVPYVY